MICFRVSIHGCLLNAVLQEYVVLLSCVSYVLMHSFRMPDRWPSMTFAVPYEYTMLLSMTMCCSVCLHVCMSFRLVRRLHAYCLRLSGSSNPGSGGTLE